MALSCIVSPKQIAWSIPALTSICLTSISDGDARVSWHPELFVITKEGLYVPLWI